MERRLAAILAADVVDYSRLMGEDELRTLDALQTLRREIFGPAVAGHRGRVLKSMGDGWLVEFKSVADAVMCAVQIQDRVANHEIIRLRMGLHIGDISEDQEDVYGDGVNVASRLETFAEPGALALSDAVFGTIDGTLRPAFDDVGIHELKNINRPIQIWMRQPQPTRNTAQGPNTSSDGEITESERPVLALYPIETSDERPDVRELANALTNDVETYLRAANWLYTATTASSENATYVLRSVLRGSGLQLRLEAQLTNGAGDRLWRGKFDGDLNTAFDWQDITSEDLVAQVVGPMLEAEKSKLSNISLEQMTATQCELYAQLFIGSMDGQGFSVAMRYIDAAIEKDPKFVDAYATAILFFLAAISADLAEEVAPYSDRFNNWISAARPYRSSHALLDLLIGLSDFRGDQDAATMSRVVARVLRLGATDSVTMMMCGWILVWLGRPEEALDCFEKASRPGRSGPWAAILDGGMVIAYVEADRNEAAIALALRVIEASENYSAPYRALAAAYANAGRIEEAQTTIARLIERYPMSSISGTRKRSAYVENEFTERYFVGLRLAGLPEGE